MLLCACKIRGVQGQGSAEQGDAEQGLTWLHLK